MAEMVLSTHRLEPRQPVKMVKGVVEVVLTLVIMAWEMVVLVW